MAILQNDILIHASIEKIWDILTDLEKLDKYDPTVKKSTLLSANKTNIGAMRKVEMRDGKNWFDEKITVYKPYEVLTYELTACSFPIHQLRHSYRFEKAGAQTKVNQVMEYTVKFGWFGKLLDMLMIRRQSDKGIKKFFAGLKSFAESQ